jgi:hypothetical protein
MLPLGGQYYSAGDTGRWKKSRSFRQLRHRGSAAPQSEFQTEAVPTSYIRTRAV